MWTTPGASAKVTFISRLWRHARSYWDPPAPRPDQAAGSLKPGLNLATLTKWHSTIAGEGPAVPVRAEHLTTWKVAKQEQKLSSH